MATNEHKDKAQDLIVYLGLVLQHFLRQLVFTLWNLLAFQPQSTHCLLYLFVCLCVYRKSCSSPMTVFALPNMFAKSYVFQSGFVVQNLHGSNPETNACE